MYECHIQVLTGYQPRTTCMYNLLSQGQIIFGQTPESGIPPSYRATSRYTKVHLGFCLRFSTLIGQIGSVPLFGAGPRRYIRSRLFRFAVTAFWRALTTSYRQKGKRKQTFPRAIRTTELAFESFAPDISEQPDPNLTDTQPWQPTSLSKILTHTGRGCHGHAHTYNVKQRDKSPESPATPCRTAKQTLLLLHRHKVWGGLLLPCMQRVVSVEVYVLGDS